MDIVDAQLHGNLVGPLAGSSDISATVNATVAAMDAVGVDAVLLDDFTGWDKGRVLPGYETPEGAWRPDLRFSKLAVHTHPSRFGYVTRVDPHDPDLPRLIAEVRETPGRLGFRLLRGPGGFIWQDPDWLEGGYSQLFEHAEVNQVPVFVLATGRLETLEPYLRRFRDLTFILDHMGIPLRSGPAALDEDFETVLGLAKHPNLAVKWCHVQWVTDDPPPFRSPRMHLRRLVDEFGANRVMWASDWTQARRSDLSENASNWSQLLCHVKDSEALTDSEKEWVLGRTVRDLLRWNGLST